MPGTLADNLKFDGINGQDIVKYEDADLKSIYEASSTYCDATVIGAENVEDSLKENLKNSVENYLEFKGDDYVDAVHSLYESICVEESVA